MVRSLLAASVVLSLSAFGQAAGGNDVEALRKELDATKKEMKDLREEMRAQLANQAATAGWQDDWVPEKRKLETFVPDGYFRVRPDLMYHMDLGRGKDPSGYDIFPRSPSSEKDRTVAGVNMRFRFEPTFNISEEVRIHAQIDMFDNVLFGSNPDYAFSRNAAMGYAYDRNEFSIFSESQSAPTSGVNSLVNSIAVKRIWGEVETPVGILKFGRMGSHWGLGMLHNDGNCLDCNLGDTVDRIEFVAEPISGWYIVPALDFNVEGPQSTATRNGVPFDLSNSDDAHSLVISAGRIDMPNKAKTKIDAGQTLFNFGAHFTYRWQKKDPQDYYGAPFVNDAENTPGINGAFVYRYAKLFIPDIWVKVERKEFRIELEAAAVLGDVGNSALSGAANLDNTLNQGLGIIQFGAVLQTEVRLFDGNLKIGVEAGFASGDEQPGFGNYPRRKAKGPNGAPLVGDIDGQQYVCPGAACDQVNGRVDHFVRNFRFNRDYQVDMILFHELLGGVTDAIYIKPNASYRLADGFHIFASAIYSRAIYAESTPSAHFAPGSGVACVTPSAACVVIGDANLGLEVNAGARYETEDGFFGELRWGILFPLQGLANNQVNALTNGGVPVTLEPAQAIRGSIGIKF
jgi:uncharacterized protein (TIGR04551 family)